MNTDQPLESDLCFRRYVRLESIDPERNRFRFFLLRWQPTLWNGPALVRTWGRVGAAGRSRVVEVPDGSDPQETVRRVLRRRLRHGYRVVEWR